MLYNKSNILIKKIQIIFKHALFLINTRRNYGHKVIKARVRVLCEVQDGPEYDLNFRGEASVLSYQIIEHFFDLGYVVIFLTFLFLVS